MEATERMRAVIRLIDVPDAATAEEAERLMNGPLDQGNYLLVNVLYMEPMRSTRAVYRLSAREQAGTATGNRSDADGKDDAARAVVQVNQHLTVPAQTPASNPAYCYEWAFIEPGRVVVLNVWHGEIRERNGQVWRDLNPRAWSEKGRQTTTLHPSERGALSKRAIRMDEAIAFAYGNRLPVRLIVGEGQQRDITNPKSKAASRMKLRLLDPEPWSVQRYNQKTGQCRLSRGTAPRYVDQFTTPEPRSPQQHEVTGKVWERDRRVGDAALLRQRANVSCAASWGFVRRAAVFTWKPTMLFRCLKRALTMSGTWLHSVPTITGGTSRGAPGRDTDPVACDACRCLWPLTLWAIIGSLCLRFSRFLLLCTCLLLLLLLSPFFLSFPRGICFTA